MIVMMIMMMIVMTVMMMVMMMTCLLLLMPLSRESEEEAVGREGSELSREELVSILNTDYTVNICSVNMQSFFNTTVNIETIAEWEILRSLVLPVSGSVGVSVAEGGGHWL